MARMAIHLYEVQTSAHALAEAMLLKTASETLDSWAAQKGYAAKNYNMVMGQLQRHFICAGNSEGIGSAVAQTQIGRFKQIMQEAISDGLGLTQVGRF